MQLFVAMKRRYDGKNDKASEILSIMMKTTIMSITCDYISQVCTAQSINLLNL